MHTLKHTHTLAQVDPSFHFSFKHKIQSLAMITTLCLSLDFWPLVSSFYSWLSLSGQLSDSSMVNIVHAHFSWSLGWNLILQHPYHHLEYINVKFITMQIHFDFRSLKHDVQNTAWESSKGSERWHNILVIQKEGVFVSNLEVTVDMST